MFNKKKKDKKSRKKGTVVDPRTVVPRSAFIEERLKRLKAEKQSEKKSDTLETKDLTALLDDLSDLDSSSSESDSDSSSESSSSGSDDSLSSLNKKIENLQTKQRKKRRAKEIEWVTESQKLENKRWKQKELWVDQELYTKHKANRREIMEVGGPQNWIQKLFKHVNTGMKVNENLVWKMVTKFAVVMFVKDINKDAGKSSEIIESVRRKHNIDEDEVLEVVLDDSHAGKLTFIDLQRLTNKRNFPQIFVNETFVGGLPELKTEEDEQLDFAGKGLLLRQILIFQGIVDRKCEKCIELKDHRKMHNVSRNKD